MAGSSFGTIFRITTWGESHGTAIGVTIDGCPAGLPLNASDIQKFLDLRRPGQHKYTTGRKENDTVEILSGIFQGQTTGTPISLLIPNTNQVSKDYQDIADYYRPGHADYTFAQKYGIRDYRGGGRSSGRETIGRVAAGAVAMKILESLGIKVFAYTKSIGPISVPSNTYDFQVCASNKFFMPNTALAEQAEIYLDTCIANHDSVGGIIECQALHLPVGLGDTVFEKLDANLGKALLSIGSVKGVEIGDGFQAATANGSSNNDAFHLVDGTIVKSTNHAGGVLGGMSDGSPLLARVAIKPTPSISLPQQTVHTTGRESTISIHGRHDPIIVPRAVVVVQAMTALTIVDALFLNMSSKLDKIVEYYQ